MGNDIDDVDDNATERKHERASSVEDILSTVREDLGDQTYPTTSEELSARYADEPLDAPNETESLASAFDRIDESFEDAETAYDALVTEFERGEYTGRRTDGVSDAGPTWSEERVDDDRPPADQEIEGEPKRSAERAREAQAEAAESDTDDGE